MELHRCCFLLCLNQSHQSRKSCGQYRYKCHCQKQKEQYAKVRQQCFGDILDTDFADTAAYEKYGANRRCDVTHTHVENQHNTELDIGHSQTLCDRKEDRCENQDGRCDIHEHTDNQKDHVHQQEDYNLVCGDGHDTGADCCRDS